MLVVVVTMAIVVVCDHYLQNCFQNFAALVRDIHHVFQSLYFSPSLVSPFLLLFLLSYTSLSSYVLFPVPSLLPLLLTPSLYFNLSLS